MNVTEMRNELVDVFRKLRNGELEGKDATEINNTAGKIINSVKVQLAYHAMRGEKPEITFLEQTSASTSPAMVQRCPPELESAAPRGLRQKGATN